MVSPSDLALWAFHFLFWIPARCCLPSVMSRFLWSNTTWASQSMPRFMYWLHGRSFILFRNMTTDDPCPFLCPVPFLLQLLPLLQIVLNLSGHLSTEKRPVCQSLCSLCKLLLQLQALGSHFIAKTRNLSSQDAQYVEPVTPALQSNLAYWSCFYSHWPAAPMRSGRLGLVFGWSKSTRRVSRLRVSGRI